VFGLTEQGERNIDEQFGAIVQLTTLIIFVITDNSPTNGEVSLVKDKRDCWKAIDWVGCGSTCIEYPTEIFASSES